MSDERGWRDSVFYGPLPLSGRTILATMASSTQQGHEIRQHWPSRSSVPLLFFFIPGFFRSELPGWPPQSRPTDHQSPQKTSTMFPAMGGTRTHLIRLRPLVSEIS